MKKKYSIIIFSFLILILIFSKLKENGLDSIKGKHEKLILSHPFNNTIQLSKEERLTYNLPPNKYYEQLYLLQMNPYTGRTHPENLYNLQEELKEKRKLQERTPGDAIDNKWIERGPNNVGGRTRVVMFDPNDVTNKRVFAGGVSGGLWVNNDITDENSSWTRVDIDENLSVTCMAVDPNNSQIMYLGTGELYSPQQALGDGIWKSTDGGVTWNNVYQLRGATTNGIVPGTYYMTDIIVRDKDGSSATTNDSEVFASIGSSFYSSNPINTFLGVNEYGIFKSTDNGSNWNRVSLDVNGNPVAANDFELGQDNTLWLGTTRNVYGDGGGRIYSSTDGTNFTLKHSITNARRVELATSKINANTIYVLARIRTVDVNNNEITPFVEILKTTDAFATTPSSLSIPNDADTNIPADDFTRGQAFYNLTIEVDPTNDAIAYVGGIDLFRTTDSGTTWNQISKWSNNNNLAALEVSYVHADQHAMVFHPTDNNKAVFGNDGGVFYATSLSDASSSTSAIRERTKDYITTQYYHSDIGQTENPDYLIGGTQDNGTLFFNYASSGINSALKAFGGDGTRTFLDESSNYMIVTYLYNRILKFDLPYTGSYTTIATDRSTGSFVNAMDLDKNLDIIYSNGTNHLARFTDITTSSPIRTNITDDLLTNITAVKVSPFTTTSSKVFVGTQSGKVVKIENANTASQTVTDISSDDFLGSISSIQFGASENEIMVTFYNFGVESIWYTSDGGTNWTNKEGNFPDITVRDIMMNPLNNDEVIIATELGVWNTSNFKDASPNWNQSYNGISNVAVTSLSLRTSDNTILASSYGRGLYTGKFSTNDITVWKGTTNSDWFTASNWSNGVPTSTTDASIPITVNNPSINANAIAANVIIESNAILTITENGSLDIQSNLTNEGSITINSSLSSSGTLIVDGTSSGVINYNRYATSNWHLVSSPVTNETYDNNWVSTNSIASGQANPNQRGIGTYNNNSGTWNYMLANESSSFENGKAYAIKRTLDGNILYSGNLSTTPVNIVLTEGTTNAFNLIGNPFTAYIPITNDADANHNFLEVNSSFLNEQSIYIWNGTSYITYNHATGSLFLPPSQGFFVRAKEGGSTVSFTADMQQHQSGTFFKTKQNTRPELRLTLKSNSLETYTDVFYIENTTTGFDNGFDSSSFNGENSNFTINSKLASGEEKELAIQSIPVDFSIVIPLSVKVIANSSNEIHLTSKNLPEKIKVYLYDNVNNSYVLLDNDDKFFSFNSNGQTIESNRFFLYTTKETLNLETNEVDKLNIFYNQKKVTIIRLSQETLEFTIYNLLGKNVMKKTLKNNENSVDVSFLSKGVYVINVSSEKQRVSKKIIIH